MKTGEKLVRHCIKRRDSGFTTTHEFTIYSDAFSHELHLPEHILKLFSHFRTAFASGVPERVKTCSKTPISADLVSSAHETDLKAYAELSGYMGGGRSQHPIVQNYLHEWDPLTIATEVPVWSDDTNGFIDIIRVHPDFTIEIADFKPKAKTDKKAPGQVWKYRNLLVDLLEIPAELVICTYFDHEHAYIVTPPTHGKDQK